MWSQYKTKTKTTGIKSGGRMLPPKYCSGVLKATPRNRSMAQGPKEKSWGPHGHTRWYGDRGMAYNAGDQIQGFHMSSMHYTPLSYASRPNWFH